MLNAICRELHNYFCEDADKHFAEYTIADGVISPFPALKVGQYFRIVGSVLNDGVYKYTGEAISTLSDETFDGAIWGMKVPAEVVTLASDVSSWVTANASASASPFQSESFGGYSYSKKTGANGSNYTWKDAFRGELNMWRKI